MNFISPLPTTNRDKFRQITIIEPQLRKKRVNYSFNCKIDALTFTHHVSQANYKLVDREAIKVENSSKIVYKSVVIVSFINIIILYTSNTKMGACNVDCFEPSHELQFLVPFSPKPNPQILSTQHSTESLARTQAPSKISVSRNLLLTQYEMTKKKNRVDLWSPTSCRSSEEPDFYQLLLNQKEGKESSRPKEAKTLNYSNSKKSITFYQEIGTVPIIFRERL